MRSVGLFLHDITCAVVGASVVWLADINKGHYVCHLRSDQEEHELSAKVAANPQWTQ